ncbi:MAG: ABC transporter ATP-binding protein, partial [Candidatus Dormibacteraeota bacterium]|nr:ABC transporter ATP-binding protein [Candidatus Dormibacteraeota bacterium]
MRPPGHGPSMFAMWAGARARRTETGPANSGLTGDPIIEGPPEQEGPKDLRSRWRNLRDSVRGTAAALPRVIAIVWQANRRVTILLFATTVIAGIIPAISAYTAKLLINAVVQGIAVHRFHLPDRVQFDFGPLHTPVFTTINGIIFLAVLQLLIFALTAFLGTTRNITQQLLQNSVSMRIQLMVMEKAATLDLSFYEDPASYDLLRRAQTDSVNRPVLMISTAFGLVQTALTFVTMIALLVVVSPLLALIALVSPIPAFIADTRYGWRGYNIARWGSRLMRRMN